MNIPDIVSLLHVGQTDSTQTLARALAEQGAADRTLVWADRQTHGRGRLRRKWQSPTGGLYFSLIIRPPLPPSRLGEISLMTANVVAQTLAGHAGIKTATKPPNDVLAFKEDQAKKICGILCEASGTGKQTDWLIVGVGINVNNKPRLKRAISLRDITGKTWDIRGVLKMLLREWEQSYRKLK